MSGKKLFKVEKLGIPIFYALYNQKSTDRDYDPESSKTG